MSVGVQNGRDAIGRRRFLRALGMGAGAVMLPAFPTAASFRASVERGAPVFDIRDFGARGDGNFDNRLSIQRAIDQCASRGGGTVYVPAGRFVTGAVRLRSHIRLLLEQGGTLAGSSDPAAYERRAPVPHTPGDGWGSALILAENCKHVSIEGHGTITGGGLAVNPDGEQGPFRPRLLALEGCRHVLVQELTLRDSDRWTLHLYQCDHVRVRGLGIYAGAQVLNTDAIDVDGCDNVLVSDCDIAVGDDCVCLKTTDYLGPPRPCRNVTVTNCAFATRSTGFKIGTETHADFTNVVFSNSVVYAADGVEPHTGIALESVDGAHVRGVAVTNVSMRGVVAPLFLRLGNRGRRQAVPTPGTLRDVTIQNVVATGASLASSITGIPGHPVENVSVADVRVEARGGGDPTLSNLVVEEREADYPRSTMFGELPAYGLYLRHAADVALRDLHLQTEAPDGRPVFHAEDVEGLRVDGLTGDREARAENVIRLRDVRKAFVRAAPPPAGSAAGWVGVEGPRSSELWLTPEGGRGAVTRAPEVPAGAVSPAP